jgi:hypothetical protein
MHSFPLGITRHMMYAAAWAIKDYIMGFKWPPGHDMTSEEEESHGDERLSVFKNEDVLRITQRICTRLHDIRCTSQGFDLTPYMCDEPMRVFAHMHSGSHGMTAYLRAHEYMILSLLMPYVLTDLYQQELRWLQEQFDGEPPADIADRLGADPMPCIVKAWYMYMDFFCFMRKQIMTESEVCTLEDKGRKLQQYLWHAFPEKAGQRMGWHFPKMHHIDTFAASKRLYGSLELTSTQPTEHCHVYYSHKLIALTNGKDAFSQIMHFVVRSHVLRDLTMFNGDEGKSMLKDFESHNFSRSQMYSYPINLLYQQPDKVTRILSAEMRDHSGSRSKIKYERISAFCAPDGEALWGVRHPGFMFLPHLLGTFLIQRRKRFGLQLEGLQKVCALTTCANCQTCCVAWFCVACFVTHFLTHFQAPRAIRRSKHGPCTAEQANTALKCVLGPKPRGRSPLDKTDAQHRLDSNRHPVTKTMLTGVIKMHNTLEFHHQDYQDRCFRMRCHTDHTFHDKFPVVSTDAILSWVWLCVSRGVLTGCLSIHRATSGQFGMAQR